MAPNRPDTCSEPPPPLKRAMPKLKGKKNEWGFPRGEIDLDARGEGEGEHGNTYHSSILIIRFHPKYIFYLSHFMKTSLLSYFFSACIVWFSICPQVSSSSSCLFSLNWSLPSLHFLLIGAHMASLEFANDLNLEIYHLNLEMYCFSLGMACSFQICFKCINSSVKVWGGGGCPLKCFLFCIPKQLGSPDTTPSLRFIVVF